MALADEIQCLATRTLYSLDASHDYYTYTKRVWRLLRGTWILGRAPGNVLRAFHPLQVEPMRP